MKEEKINVPILHIMGASWERELIDKFLVGNDFSETFEQKLILFIRTKKAEWEEKVRDETLKGNIYTKITVNEKVNIPDELLKEIREETIRAVLPEKPLSISQNIHSIEDDGSNECRQRIIDNLKSKYNIEL